MSESVARFEENSGLDAVRRAHLMRALVQDVEPGESDAVLLLEAIVCGKIATTPCVHDTKLGWKARPITRSDLRCASQKKHLCQARKYVWLILYRHEFFGGKWSCPRIAKLYKRDHTTVLYAIKHMDEWIKHRADSREVIAFVEVLEEFTERLAELKSGA